MSRALTAGLLAAVLAGSIRPRLFYEGVFSTGTLNLWTGERDIVWNSKTWTAAGQMLEISPVEEASEVRAVNFTVALNGESAALLSVNLGAARQGLDGTVWIGALDAAGALIVDPFKAFAGRLDRPEITDDGASCRIAVLYESRLIDLERARARHYTHEDQQIDFAGDRGFEFVPGLQDATIPWGQAGQAVPPNTFFGKLITRSINLD